MLFEIPTEITDYLAVLDDFIEREIKPIEQRDDNIRFFDHRREHARTDWDNYGLPRADWWALLAEMRRVADAAGHYRYAIPAEFNGQDGSNLSMAVIRHHLAHKGLGLHNDLQNESSIVGNLVQVLMLRDFGTPQQKRDFIPLMLEGKMGWSFGLTEEHHGSDATHMDTRAVPEVRDGVAGYVINGNKMWTTGLPYTSHVMTFARTNGDNGKARGITCFVVPSDAPGFEIGEYMWTFNMPTDHPKVKYTDVWVPESAMLGELTMVSRSRSILCTKTASGKRQARWVLRNIVSTGRSTTRANANHLANRWRSIRAFSFLWWSCKPMPKCCGY